MLGAWLVWGGVAWLASRWSPGLPASVPEPSWYGASNGHVGWSRTSVDAAEVLSGTSTFASCERAQGKPGLDALDPSNDSLKPGACPGDFMRRNSALQHDHAERTLETRPNNRPVDIETAIARAKSGRGTAGYRHETAHHGVADGASSRRGAPIPRFPVSRRNAESTPGKEREQSDRNGAGERIPGVMASGSREDASPNCEARRHINDASSTFVYRNGAERDFVAEETLHQTGNRELYTKLVSAGPQNSPLKTCAELEIETGAVDRFSNSSSQPSSNFSSSYRNASPVRLRDALQPPEQSSFEDGLIHSGTRAPAGVFDSKTVEQRADPTAPRASQALKYENGNSLVSPASRNRCAVVGDISHSETVSELQPHSANCLEARTITAKSNSHVLGQAMSKQSEHSKSALFADDTRTGRNAERLAPSLVCNSSSGSDGETNRARLTRSPSNGPMLPRHLSSSDRLSEAGGGDHFSVLPRVGSSKLSTEEKSSHDARRSSAWSSHTERQQDSVALAKVSNQHGPILGRASEKTTPRRARSNPSRVEQATACDDDTLEYRAELQSQTPSYMEQRLWMNPLDGVDESRDETLQRQREPRSTLSIERKEPRRFAGNGGVVAGLRESHVSPATRPESISPSAPSMPSFIPLESPPNARCRRPALSACSRGISPKNTTVLATSISPTCFRGTQSASRPLEPKTQAVSSPIWGMLHQAVESVSGGSPFTISCGQRRRRGIKQGRIHSRPHQSRRWPNRHPPEEAHQTEHETKIQLSDLSEDSATPVYSTRILAELDAAHQENEFLRERLSRMAVLLDMMRTQQKANTGLRRPDEQANGPGEPKWPDQASVHRERGTLPASGPDDELTPASTHERPSAFSDENYGRTFPDTRRGPPKDASRSGRLAHDRTGRFTSPRLTDSKASIEKRSLPAYDEYRRFRSPEADAGPAHALGKTVDVIDTPNRVSPKRVSSTQRSSSVVLYPHASMEHCYQQQV